MSDGCVAKTVVFWVIEPYSFLIINVSEETAVSNFRAHLQLIWRHYERFKILVTVSMKILLLEYEIVYSNKTNQIWAVSCMFLQGRWFLDSQTHHFLRSHNVMTMWHHNAVIQTRKTWISRESYNEQDELVRVGEYMVRVIAAKHTGEGRENTYSFHIWSDFTAEFKNEWRYISLPSIRLQGLTLT